MNAESMRSLFCALDGFETSSAALGFNFRTQLHISCEDLIISFDNDQIMIDDIEMVTEYDVWALKSKFEVIHRFQLTL